MSYRFVKITSYYREFLEYYYNRYPEIKDKTYSEQLNHLMRQEFAWSDYYQRNLNSLGVEAHEIICNARFLQEAWAKENGFKQNGRALVFEQIKKIQAEVVFFQDTSLFNGEWIKHLRENIPSIKKIIGFRCSPYTADLAENFRCFDFMVVCSDQFVKELEQYHYKVYELNHAFEHTIISMITENNSQAATDLVFIGSLLSGAGFHSKRKQLVEKMIERNIHLDFYGNVPVIGNFDLFSRRMAYISFKLLKKIGLKAMAVSMPLLRKAANLSSMPEKNTVSEKLKNKLHPPVYGLGMYRLLYRSKVAFNMHADIASGSAANIRLFEATGCGSCLLTDWKPNMKNFFEEDSEIVAYRSEEDCIEKALWLMEHEKEREQIALRGQKRTLSEHSYKNRAEKLNNIILNELKTL